MPAYLGTYSPTYSYYRGYVDIWLRCWCCAVQLSQSLQSTDLWQKSRDPVIPCSGGRINMKQKAGQEKQAKLLPSSSQPETQTTINDGALAYSNLPAAHSQRVCLLRRRMGQHWLPLIPSPEKYTNGDDKHKVPGKWIKRARSWATRHMLFPMHRASIILHK